MLLFPPKDFLWGTKNMGMKATVEFIPRFVCTSERGKAGWPVLKRSEILVNVNR